MIGGTGVTSHVTIKVNLPLSEAVGSPLIFPEAAMETTPIHSLQSPALPTTSSPTPFHQSHKKEG